MTRLPTRRLKVVYEIMRARIRKAIDLGCDGIEPDNMSVRITRLKAKSGRYLICPACM